MRPVRRIFCPATEALASAWLSVSVFEFAVLVGDIGDNCGECVVVDDDGAAQPTQTNDEIKQSKVSWVSRNMILS